MTDRTDPSPPPAGFPFSPQDALEFMQKMWNPLGVPIPGFALPGTSAAAPPAPGMRCRFRIRRRCSRRSTRPSSSARSAS